jgi:hypothetical protein
MKNPDIVTARNWYFWLWLSPIVTIPLFGVLVVLGILVVIVVRDVPGMGYISYTAPLLLIGTFAIVGSALSHLILLFPTLGGRNKFVRWHGSQALLLAGIRTVIPLGILFYIGTGQGDEIAVIASISVLCAVWLFGTIWGQVEAAYGDCTLMRWAGQGAGLPLPARKPKPAATPRDGLPAREKPEHRAAYHSGLSLLRQGRPDAAAEIFCRLLVSEATPQCKARVAVALKQTGQLCNNAPADVLVALVRFSPDSDQRRTGLVGLEHLGLVEAL